MSPFDYKMHFELFGYGFNVGFLWKGQVGLSPRWKRVWKFYFCIPFKHRKSNDKA